MKKLRLLGLSLLACFSITAQAVEQPQPVELQALVIEAISSINLQEILPVNDAHISVQQQSKDSLLEASSQVLPKRLVAMNFEEAPVNAE